MCHSFYMPITHTYQQKDALWKVKIFDFNCVISWLFTKKSPGILGTQLIDRQRTKDLKESTLEPPSYFQSQTLYWETSVLTTSHENKNQISTLTTRMNGSQVYFHLLVFVVTMSFKRWRTVVLLSSQMIDANENFRFIKKNWKVIIETYCELKSWLKITDKQVQIWNPVPPL